uniref:FAD-binding PCMH-type domain-containing protein n=2 Tax=Physcomitrium patens TaxID=3218 RepID=A0A2K1JIK3_PHYPA|nr:hypothetical protein PHYPA_018781 [Physcomitrium patens]
MVENKMAALFRQGCPDGFIYSVASVLISCIVVSKMAAGTNVLELTTTNWAGNIVFHRDVLQEADSVEKIRTLVKSKGKVKALGSGHCFNTIADTDDNQLSLKPMHKVLALDDKARTVTVDAGITYAQLCPYLDSKGFALHNLASLLDTTVAGAISTATHGSGNKNGNLATAVYALEFVHANGDVVKYSRGSSHSDELNPIQAVVVGLGALGVITRITLDIQPTYTVRQWVYENLPLEELAENFDAITSGGYSVSFFTDWQKKRIKQLWIKVREGYGQPFWGPKKYFGATLATRKLHPIEGFNAANCTDQLGIPGPWYDRLPHFRLGSIPSAGDELQSEYIVARSDAVDAILAVETLGNQIGPHLFVSEIRTIAADDLWMSTAYGRQSVAIHFTWKNELAAVQRLMTLIEGKLAPFHPRPHWGKLFTVPPAELHSEYEKLPSFLRMADEHDPSGKFRNDFLDTNLFSS